MRLFSSTDSRSAFNLAVSRMRRAAALATVVEGGGDALAALQKALELAVHHRERLLRLAGGV